MALNTQLKNFSTKSRGRIVGLMACFFGLCSGIFTQLYKGFFTTDGNSDAGDIGAFLLFMAIAIPSIALVCSMGTNVLTNPGDADPPVAEPRRILLGISWARRLGTAKDSA